MSSRRNLFLNHVAQTSTMPLGLVVDRAEGMYIYDQNGKKYLDLNSGISVSSLGHRHVDVVNAIKNQVDKYMHTMVYGEHIQGPQTKYASSLLELLDKHFQQIYFLMTGTEAVELSIKMARLFSGKVEILACENAYHGSTAGAESLRSDIGFTKFMAPGVPGVGHIRFNSVEDLEKISDQTAAVITEPVQAEGGVVLPENDYLRKLSARCKETKTLLILDEIQTGFCRSGSWFAHQKYGIVPDILLIAKSMGGGMPIGAVVSSKEIMQSIVKNPALAHITTFGGHPVSVAAALASLEFMKKTNLPSTVVEKSALFKKFLVHPIIKEVRQNGLMMAVELTKRKYLKHVVEHTIDQGALIDYFLFNQKSFRLAPPLIINEEQIQIACDILLKSMDLAQKRYT